MKNCVETRPSPRAPDGDGAYASYIQEAVLRRAGGRDMAIAFNARGERQTREVCYYAPPGVDPHRANVRRMDSHGGGIASANGLVMFQSSDRARAGDSSTARVG